MQIIIFDDAQKMAANAAEWVAEVINKNMMINQKFGLCTRYHSKCRISVGIKMTLGKENKLCIVILWFDYLTPYKVILNPSKKRLSNITSSLL
jgi:hypothetical protein